MSGETAAGFLGNALVVIGGIMVVIQRLARLETKLSILCRLCPKMRAAATARCDAADE